MRSREKKRARSYEASQYMCITGCVCKKLTSVVQETPAAGEIRSPSLSSSSLCEDKVGVLVAGRGQMDGVMD